MDYIERIADMGACAPALAWLRSEQHPTLQAAWDACPRSNWMLWLLHKHADALYWAARSGHISDVDAAYAAYAAARGAADAAYDATQDAAYDAADAAYAAAYAAADADAADAERAWQRARLLQYLAGEVSP